MVDKSWNQEVGGALRATSGCPEPGSEDELAVWACPICDCQFSSTAALKTHARRAHKLVEPRENIFDRTKHAVNGLPQCAGCMKKFSRWQTLQQHINNHSCPAGVTAAPHNNNDSLAIHPCQADQPAPKFDATSVDTYPGVGGSTQDEQRLPSSPQPAVPLSELSPNTFQEQQLLIQSVVAHGVNQFIQHPELTRTMLHTCMLCGQWVASHRVMKLHYRHTHAQTLQALQRRASRIVQQRATPCATCHFCGGKHKDWKAHLHKCTALWQCSILCAKHEEQQHDGRADGGVLWGCQEGGGLLGPMEGLCSFDARSPQSLRDAPNGKRRREPFRGNQHPQVPQQSPFQYGRLPSRDPLLTTLARAVLRQQEELRVLRQDTSFILFMKPGEDGVMNVLYKAALIDLQGQAGGGTHVAVRSTATPHGSDYDHVQGTDGSLESNAGISELRTKAGGTQTGWRFQRWNASLRQLDSSRPPIPDDRMLDHLATLIQCLKHPIITRFRCKRKLMETMTSQATFLLDISLRCHSAITMWDTMKILQNNAVFQLVGLAYKPESLGSGAQEKQIRDMAFSRT